MHGVAVSDEATTFEDGIYHLQVPRLDVHGRLVRLGRSLDTILSQHAYPRPVTELLGQLVAMAAGLSTTMKFDGAFTVQISGDGPLHTVVADLTSAGAVRGYAGFDEGKVAEIAAAPPETWTKNRLVGRGHLALTVDQGPDADRYQGIVALSDGDLADDIATYFRDSEQMPAVLRTAVARDSMGAGWRAGCLLVHRYPRPDIDLEEEENEENWRYVRAVTESLEDAELTAPQLKPAKLLYNLFGTFDATMSGPKNVRFGCRCSRERAHDMLMRLPEDELPEMIVDGSIFVVCGFCSQRYDFDPAGPELRRH